MYICKQHLYSNIERSGKWWECTHNTYTAQSRNHIRVFFTVCGTRCCLGRRGRSCRGESETAADPGAAFTLRAHRRSSKSPRAWGAVLLGASYLARLFFPARLTVRASSKTPFPSLVVAVVSVFCYAPSWPGLRFCATSVRERVFGRRWLSERRAVAVVGKWNPRTRPRLAHLPSHSVNSRIQCSQLSWNTAQVGAICCSTFNHRAHVPPFLSAINRRLTWCYPLTLSIDCLSSSVPVSYVPTCSVSRPWHLAVRWHQSIT
ncbi:hypothetical protein BC826DRAFT_1035524, partial [Russula brevipes]